MADSTEPHVSRDELRAALVSPGARPRPNRALEPLGRPPAWDWDPDGSEIKVTKLEDRISDLEREIAELQADGQRAAERRSELQAGLRELAGAGWRERKRVRGSLLARGLL
jgi:hypothetical protein